MKRTAAEHARRNMVKRNRAVTSPETTEVVSEPVVETPVEAEAEKVADEVTEEVSEEPVASTKKKRSSK